MKKAVFASALFVAVVMCAPGVVSAGTMASISDTGAFSWNTIKVKGSSKLKVSVKNNTNTQVSVNTNQAAASGDAKVLFNTGGGDATTGDAGNENETTGVLSVENVTDTSDECGCEGNGVSASISDTGFKSKNIIKIGAGGSKVGTKIKNNTNIQVANNTNQQANSGDATVFGNTQGGNAESGAAGNVNGTDLTVLVVNDNSGSGDCGCGGSRTATIMGTGTASYNAIYLGGSGSGGLYISNNTNTAVVNNTNQSAVSGNAKVAGNTGGGNATTGSATNSNTTVLGVGVSNTN